MIYNGTVIISFLAMLIIGLSLDLKTLLKEFTKFDRKFISIIISQILLVPLITIFVTEFFFNLEEYEKLFLVILSLAPGAFLSTAFVALNKGNVYLSVKASVLIALISIITMPLVLKLYLLVNISNLQLDIAKSIFRLLIIIGIPVLLGSVLRLYFKPFADVITRKIFIVIFFGLYGLAIAEMSQEWPGINFLLSALPEMTILIVLYIIFSTTICLLFQLSTHNARTVIIETYMQNIPLVAMIGLFLMPNEPVLILGAIWTALQSMIGLVYYIYLRQTNTL
jgi:predicted Na+-dependent transporter